MTGFEIFSAYLDKSLKGIKLKFVVKRNRYSFRLQGKMEGLLLFKGYWDNSPSDEGVLSQLSSDSDCRKFAMTCFDSCIARIDFHKKGEPSFIKAFIEQIYDIGKNISLAWPK